MPWRGGAPPAVRRRAHATASPATRRSTALTSGQDLSRASTRSSRVNIAPPTDDSPFFFHTAPAPRHLRAAPCGGPASAAMPPTSRPSGVLGVLLITVIGAHPPVHRRAAGPDHRPQRAGGHHAALRVLRRHRPRLHARRDLADAAADRLPRPSRPMGSRWCSSPCSPPAGWAASSPAASHGARRPVRRRRCSSLLVDAGGLRRRHARLPSAPSRRRRHPYGSRWR